MTQISFRLNGEHVELEVQPQATLLETLRETFGLFSVKHGCETGECGACTILLDGRPVNTCVMLAVQADGRSIETVEVMGGGIGNQPHW